VIVSDCCSEKDDEVHLTLIEKVLARQASVVTSRELMVGL
jgi:hypothetical protein